MSNVISLGSSRKQWTRCCAGEVVVKALDTAGRRVVSIAVSMAEAARMFGGAFFAPS
jgi:D-tyrosyl-tRNA(Tyr) deacylase